MKRKLCLTPEQDAVAYVRLSGYEVAEGVKGVMLRIARGEMSADQLEAWENQQENRGIR